MSRKLAYEKLQELYETLDPKTILEHIIGNYMFGNEALEALQAVEKDLCEDCNSCDCDDEDCEI